MKKFAAKDYEQVLAEFEELADEKYREFHSSLIPNNEINYGVRIPEIRKISKRIIKSDPFGFLEISQSNSYEEVVLRAFVISTMKTDIDTRLNHMEDFLPFITDWSICDTLCTAFKPKGDERDIVWQFVLPYFNDSREFYARFAVVMFLANFIDEEHTKEGLDYLMNIKNDAYYVQMAVAWAVSVCFVKKRETTLPFIKAMKLDKFTQNKSIQKIRESFRATEEDKDMLLQYKK